MYESQRWLFDSAAGRFDLDLSISGMAARDCAELLARAPSRASYSTDRGGEVLREQVAAAYGVPRDHVMITHGAQEAMYLLMASTLWPGDRVTVHSPGWQQLTHLPPCFGAEVVLVGVGDDPDGRLGLKGIAAAAGDTRMVVLNTPHNPTGRAVTDSTEWNTLAVAAADGVIVVNDEEYLTDYRDSVVHRLPGACAVSSLSKVYGFPGLRTGWLVGPPVLIERCVNYRRYTTISNSPILEWIAAEVLDDRQRYLAEYADLLAARWAQFEDWSKGEPWLQVTPPRGTPFVLCAYDLKIDSSMMLCEHMLDSERLLLMPGDAFGAPDRIRISFARPAEMLAEGLARISRAIKTLTFRLS